MGGVRHITFMNSADPVLTQLLASEKSSRASGNHQENYDAIKKCIEYFMGRNEMDELFNIIGLFCKKRGIIKEVNLLT